MPGDTVEAKNGVLYINGKEVEQPFINTNNDKKTVFIDDFTLKELTERTRFLKEILCHGRQ